MPEVTSTEIAAYYRLVREFPDHQFRAGLAYLDIDALADGIMAQKSGKEFHENPYGAQTPTVQRLSWHMGWNERALRKGG